AHRLPPAEPDARERSPAAGHRSHAACRSARLAERTRNSDVKPHDGRFQLLYARWLDAATKTGFAASLCAFLLYVFGALPPYVAPERLPELWGLPVGRFLEETGAPTGWRWVAL